jgi:Spy/CpxP family protein refolding chaperone
MSSRRNRMLCALSLLSALAGAAGCAADDGSGKTPYTAEADEAPTAAGGRHHPGGPEFLLVAALRELDLSAAQKTTIEGALEKAKASRPEHGPRDKAPFAALAEGVRAGKIDTAAVLAKVPDMPPGAEDRAAAASAIETLHATLTKEQRRALVVAVSNHMDEHGPPPGAPPKHKGGPLGFLLHGLDVSDAQRAAIEKALEAQRPSEADRDAMMKDHDAMGAKMRARLETFASDSFDAKAFVTPPEGAAGGPKQHIERMVKDLAVVVPILEPAQREQLASLLEKGPPMGPPHGRGGPRGK